MPPRLQEMPDEGRLPCETAQHITDPFDLIIPSKWAINYNVQLCKTLLYLESLKITSYGNF